MEENKELMKKEENNQGIVMSFNELKNNSTTKCQIYSTIEDEKVLFNLESKVDNLLNDCEDECLRIVDILIKIYKKPMQEPLVDEETGQVLRDTETSMCCILIDDLGKSYVTGSKMFTIQMIRLIQMFGINKIKQEGINIRIFKKKVGEKGNKALTFELI